MYKKETDYQFNYMDIALVVSFEYETATPQKLNRSRKPWDSEDEIVDVKHVYFEWADKLGRGKDVKAILDMDLFIEALTIEYFNHDV